MLALLSDPGGVSFIVRLSNVFVRHLCYHVNFSPPSLAAGLQDMNASTLGGYDQTNKLKSEEVEDFSVNEDPVLGKSCSLENAKFTMF